jgi:hypothetical protein
VTVIAPEIDILPVDDVGIPCNRKPCGNTAHWIVRVRHGCIAFYCDSCHAGLLEYLAIPGLKHIYCTPCDLREYFNHASEIISSIERL